MRPSQPERRSLNRYSFVENVNLSHSGGLQLPPPETTNISTGGVKLKGVRLPVGSKVRLFIPVPQHDGAKKKLLLLEACVVWMRLAGTGLKFLNVPTDAQATLQQLVTGLDASGAAA